MAKLLKERGSFHLAESVSLRAASLQLVVREELSRHGEGRCKRISGGLRITESGYSGLHGMDGATLPRQVKTQTSGHVSRSVKMGLEC